MAPRATRLRAVQLFNGFDQLRACFLVREAASYRPPLSRPRGELTVASPNLNDRPLACVRSVLTAIVMNVRST